KRGLEMGVFPRALLLAVLVFGVGNRVRAQECPGDCNLDGTVAINELITGIDMALDRSSTAACPSLDQDSNGKVEIDSLVAAVDASVHGCPCVAADGAKCTEVVPGDGAQDQILQALIEAQPGDVLLIRAGRYDLTEDLSLEVNNVTIRGEGMDRTV